MPSVLSPSTAGMLPGTLAQPVPLTMPAVPPVPSVTPQAFTGHAPTAMPTQGFTAPDPGNFTHSPDYQYQLDEALKARQRSAAARGTLLTGGTIKALQRDAAGIAAGDYQHAYDRALSTYNTNRATNAQNFGESMDTYNGDLAGFGANTSAANTYGRLGLDTQAQTYGQARQGAIDTQNNQQDINDYNAAGTSLVGAQAAADYAQQVARAREVAASQPHGGASTAYDQQVGRDLVARAAPTLAPYNYGGTLPTTRLGR